MLTNSFGCSFLGVACLLVAVRDARRRGGCVLLSAGGDVTIGGGLLRGDTSIPKDGFRERIVGRRAGSVFLIEPRRATVVTALPSRISFVASFTSSSTKSISCEMSERKFLINT